MISGRWRTPVRLHGLPRLGWVIVLLLISVTGLSAQVFEEISVVDDFSQIQTAAPLRLTPSARLARQQLPAVASPGEGSGQRQAAIVQPVGIAAREDKVVLAQYQDDVAWSSGEATLPSVRLVQGSIPRVASIEKTTPQTSPYQGPGRIITGESDGTTPTITTRPLSRLPDPPPTPRMSESRRYPSANGMDNAYSSFDEIEWDGTSSAQDYEMLPGQLNRGYSAAYTSQDQFGTPENGGLYGSQNRGQYPGGLYGSQNRSQYPGGLYGQGMTDSGIYPAAGTTGGMYGYGQEMHGYGQGMYGYGQGMYGYGGGYPGVYQPAHGLASGAFSYILCSNVWENLTVGFGGTGFKSPLEHYYDGGNGAAFGMTQTLNWATPSSSMFPVRLQAGVRAVQAYPSGYRDERLSWHRNAREQYFGTAGLFRRNIGCTPISFGVAYDKMFDNYYGKYELEQLRAELSYGSMVGVELGYRGAFGLRNDTVGHHHQYAAVQVVDYHTLFAKKYFANGGEGSLAGGATVLGDIMVRAEYGIPLSNEWGLKNSLTYLVPKGGHSPESPSRESWDISLQLVYQPHGGMLAGFCNPFRTFFDVADNGTLLRRFK